MMLYILTFTFLENRWEDKRLWTEWNQALPEFSVLFFCSRTRFWFVSVVPKRLKFATTWKDLFAMFMLCFFLSSDYVTLTSLRLL
jgi:hypothetical protein